MGQLANLMSEATLSGGMSYYDYEVRVGREVIVPWLAERMNLQGAVVGDFGCHQGGVLQALREDTPIAKGFGYDIDANNILQSPFVGDVDFNLSVGDVLKLDPETQRFDLIMIRDVIEHIPFYLDALRQAKACLNPGGRIFVSFPPYYSAFGGHQQAASNWMRLVPFIHLLPDSVFFKLLHTDETSYKNADDSLGDITSVRETRMTLSKVEAGFREAGLEIASRDCYLLRPEFRIRYGIPEVKWNVLGYLPGAREAFTMGVHYLLKADSL